MEITIDKQVVSQHCPECDIEFPVIRGSVYGGGQPMGLYLIALHGHSPQGHLGHLAIAIIDQSAGESRPLAVAMVVMAMPDQFGFSLVDWVSSPWRYESYLGEMIGQDQVRASPHRATFFHIAEHVVEDIAEVRAYFAGPGSPPDRGLS